MKYDKKRMQILIAVLVGSSVGLASMLVVNTDQLQGKFTSNQFSGQQTYSGDRSPGENLNNSGKGNGFGSGAGDEIDDGEEEAVDPWASVSAHNENLTAAFNMGNIDFDAVDDPDDYWDDYDNSWVTVGYWHVELAEDIQTCSDNVSLNVDHHSVKDDEDVDALASFQDGKIASELRMVIRDADGNVLQNLESTTLNALGKFELEEVLDEDFQVQVDMRPADPSALTDSSHMDAAYNALLSNLCVENEDGNKKIYANSFTNSGSVGYVTGEEETEQGFVGGIFSYSFE
jgi:hypothetical protein